MTEQCMYVVPRPPGEKPRAFMSHEERAKAKTGPGGKVCGKPATKKTGLNEDPYGAGFWCDQHAPAAAVPIEPLDPNKDHNPITRK